MKAILTKYLPASATKGARVKAYAEGVKPLTLPWSYGLDTEPAHRVAAEALVERMAWGPCKLVSGGLPDQSGFAFCFEA